MTGTMEFASGAWIAEAGRQLTALVHPIGHALDGVRFGVCEVYSDPPEHLRNDGRAEVAWHFVVDSSDVTVASGRHADVDLTIRADYHAAIPFAKQPAREQAKTFAALRIPDELRRALMAFHDHMAALTR